MLTGPPPKFHGTRDNLWGRAEPGQSVTVDHLGETYVVPTGDAGWWLFVAPTTPDPSPPPSAP